MTDQTDNAGPNWEEIEAEYRHGPLSVRAIAELHGPVTEGAIRKRAKANGWVRNEPATIRRMAVDRANAVGITPHLTEPTPDRIEAIAQRSADVLVRHRESASVMAGLLKKLMGQLEHGTDNEPQLADSLTEYFELKAASNPLMASMYRKQLQNALHAIDLGSRAKTMLNLANATEKLVNIERKAWSLDSDDDRRSYEDLLAEIHQKTLENAGGAPA